MSQDHQPFSDGRATRTGPGVIVATYPLAADWDGWHIAAADVDETGHFMTVRFEQTHPTTTEETR